MQVTGKPRLSLLRIIEMNVGFFGLQFSFGLQQANMGPIYGFLGADEATMPLLWLAGPMTGLLVQPIIGAMSDRTQSRWGRRTPYFLIGAIICSISLFLMPYSSALWMAASLLWILDAGNNITMEPYRAYVADRLVPDQRATGFLTQSAFTGLAQTLSYLAPTLLTAFVAKDVLDANGIPVIVKIAFIIGAILSISTIVWSVWRVPELPMTAQEKADLVGKPMTVKATLGEIGSAIKDMPRAMRQLSVAMLCQWYAMFAYWQYITFAVGRSIYDTSDPSSAAFRDATLTTQQAGALYNFIAFLGALLLIPIVRKLGARLVHAICLTASGAAMLLIPGVETPAALFVLMLGIGIGWAGMMGNTYVMLADVIPPERNGIYMGIFNMFIVIPMLIQTLTMPLFYEPLLGSDPRNVLLLGGVLMLVGAVATMFVDAGRPVPKSLRPEAN
ncbi:MFS transporter [Erythrobacter citreus]|jgi:maltose/moltooligosaccharide transporter|uniref:MFS transporter n=1 Tax=Qipengyuania citrea TaxID=225971 RepID=A0A6I4UEJ1_9SPHN|nr:MULTISPECIES: MFS transporter [Erythrobacteraceae]HBM73609.1 MFS transporter [Erythrobacter sp.]KZY92788.1 sugar transporter [Erythrobacter sp. HI0074]KZZ04470.1 sugar transporter [Erythrobacter sp. HI0077]MDQ0564831.1 maltose/moltooligosaccharide transporter [Qipengyuania citrea]MXP36144.1 MFS transporter [Qipengyuania citrea]